VFGNNIPIRGVGQENNAVRAEFVPNWEARQESVDPVTDLGILKSKFCQRRDRGRY
jgi:hypothetical protein